MKRYRIETWNQPRGVGYGWAPCSRDAKDARWFVFSSADRVIGDCLHGRDFASREDAVEAISYFQK